MLIFLLIFFNIFMIDYAAETYDCTNGTIYLNVNEIAFFETQNYPFLLTYDEKDQCDLKFVLANDKMEVNDIKNKYKFVLANDKMEKTKMVVVFYQFPSIYTDFPKVFSVSSHYSYFIQNDFPTDGYGIAEQGFITFIDDYDSCPFEYLSKEKPFEILHESQILHLRSNYFENQIRKRPCQWRFVSPDGYGFKIFIQKFNISTATIFRIVNSTDIIANERSVKANYPYYNSDSFIQIILTKGDPNFVTEMEFQAYISIIKHSQEKTNVLCSVSFDEDFIVWSNFDDIKGYDNNVQCFYELILPPKAVVVVSIDSDSSLEDNADYIKYYEINSIISKIFDYNNEPQFVIDNFKDDTDKHIQFEFVSDGSVQSRGFSINFEFIMCECSHLLAKCGSAFNYIMNPHGSVALTYYCGDLKCNITIEKCSTALTLVEFVTETHVSRNDIFRIVSNNFTTFEILDWYHDSHFTYLNSSAENILHVFTHSSSKFNTLYFYLAAVDVPLQTKIVLSEEDLTAVIDTAVNPFVVVETEFKDQYFILYSQNPYLIGLYTDTSLTKPIKYCFNYNHPKRCIVKKHSFVIFSSIGIEKTYLTIRSSQSKSNCVFEGNTYFTNQLANVTVAALSKKIGFCIIEVFVDDCYYITNLWTTAKKENVKVYAGDDQYTLYFEFNQYTQKEWKQVPLNSSIYTILIPSASAIFFALKKTEFPLTEIIADNQYKSLFATPDYGCSKRQFNTVNYVEASFFITDYPVIFTVLDYTLSPDDSFFLQINYETLDINKIGQYFIFDNQNVSLFYNTFSFTRKGGALIHIQSYNATMNDIGFYIQIIEYCF